jgi:hypothetical protein
VTGTKDQTSSERKDCEQRFPETVLLPFTMKKPNVVFACLYTGEYVLVCERSVAVHHSHQQLHQDSGPAAQRRLPVTQRYMCYIEHVYHVSCRHWGRDRFVGEPCCRSRFVDGHGVACAYAEDMGSISSSELCSNCRYRLARGPAWRPFAHVEVVLRERRKERWEQEKGQL